jgi:hypothetical protein
MVRAVDLVVRKIWANVLVRSGLFMGLAVTAALTHY